MENKFKKAIIVYGAENTGKTISLYSFYKKLKEKGIEEIFYFEPCEDFFAIVKYKGYTILIISRGDPYAMEDLYFQGIEEYLKIEGTIEEKESIFINKIDILIGASRTRGRTKNFWKERVLEKDITRINTRKYYAEEESNNLLDDAIFEELEKLISLLGQSSS